MLSFPNIKILKLKKSFFFLYFNTRVQINYEQYHGPCNILKKSFIHFLAQCLLIEAYNLLRIRFSRKH